MSQTWNPIQSGVTLFGGLFDKLMANFTTLKTRFSGTSFPANPEAGQACFRTDRGTAGVEYTYTGNSSLGESGWVETAQLATIGAELINARGSKPSLDSRLDVALNEDGSLKAGSSLNPSEWITLSGQTYTYSSTTQFTVTGDQRDVFVAKRRVKINSPGTTSFSEVVSASYSTLTTVTIADAVLASDFTTIDHSIITPVGGGRESVTAKSIGAIRADEANEFTASQKIKGDALRLRLLDSGSGGKEFSLCSDNGAVSLDENTGSENSPNWVPRLVVAPDYVTGGVPVRKCVLRAVLDSNGRNNAISAGTGLAVNLAATSTPFVVTVPYGFDDFGRPVDYLRKETADITGAWSSLTASTTNYLYYKRTSAGVWSRGFTTLAPAFGNGTAERPSSPSNGQLYYDYSKAKWDLYTTSWAEQTDSYVFVGEAVTSGSAVTSVINYAIQGFYDSGDFAASPNTTYTKSTNIGEPFVYVVLLNNYDKATDFYLSGSYGSGAMSYGQTFNSVSVLASSYLGYISGINYTSGNYRIIAKRRF